MIFSCALHENLGISMMEAVLAGCIPLMPKRASYQEMYDKEFLYPSRWTESYSAYRFNKDEVANKIRTMMADYKNYEESIQAQQERLNKYLTADIMFSKIAERKVTGKYLLKALMEYQIWNGVHILFCGDKTNGFYVASSIFKRLNEMFHE